MKTSIRVEGLDNVLANLNRQVREIPEKTKRGLISAGFLIQREAQKLTPVDTGNLKASAFVVWGSASMAASGNTGAFQGPNASEMSSDHARVVAQAAAAREAGNMVGPSVEVGYSAYYAIFVHEDTTASHIKLKRGRKKGERIAAGGKALMKRAVEGTVDLERVTQVGEAKFLEKAVDRNRAAILAKIRNEGKVP